MTQTTYLGSATSTPAPNTYQAVQAGLAAFPAWSNTPPLARARVLFSYLQLLQAHAEEFAQMLTREHGKTLADARGEVARGIEIVEFACGIPQLLKGEFSDQIARGLHPLSPTSAGNVCAGTTFSQRAVLAATRECAYNSKPCLNKDASTIGVRVGVSAWLQMRSPAVELTE